MNRPRLAFVLTVFVLAATRAAASEHADLFARLDADRDGRLIIAEVPQEHVTLFKRLVRNADSDGDGMLTLAEFETGLTSSRPAKPLTEKAENKLPGADALLLVLAWMDRNADLVITPNEVSPQLRPLFDEFVEVLNLADRQRIAIAQLAQQSLQFAGRAARFAAHTGIDVEVELALLPDAQWSYVERLRTSLAGRNMLESPAAAFVLFSRLDTNGDGTVVADEVPEPLAGRFADLLRRADRDQDKQLSEQEFNNWMSRAATVDINRPPLTETTQRAKQLIRRFDGNGDERLSRGEAPPRMAQRFDRLDQNGDRLLDVPEVARAVEILANLRNSADMRPASSPANKPRTKKAAQN